MPAMGAATTVSRIGSVTPAGAQANSRLAQVEALCRAEKVMSHFLEARLFPETASLLR